MYLRVKKRLLYRLEKKSRKGSGFVIYSYLKDSTFSAVKSVAKLLKGVNRGNTKGVPFCQKKYTKG